MRRVLVAAALPLALVTATFGAAGAASAGTSKAAYSWHVADDLLENEVGSPPYAIAEAPNGEEILLDGTGTFDPVTKAADGGGRVLHYAPDGTLLATGTFTADRLISFQFYGCGGAGLPDNLCGGLAKMEVTITPDGTSLEFPAILWVDCLLGDKIPSGGDPARAEGIRLNVPGVINFNKTHEHSGFTVFIPEG
jgi:hypothetical protein